MSDETASEILHVVIPGLLRTERADGEFSLYVPGHGTSIDVQPQSAALVEAILEGFAAPTVAEAFLQAHAEVPEELLTFLIRSCVVVEQAEVAFLEHGFLKPASTPIGAPWPLSDLPELAEPGVWGVIGVPVDMSALGAGGARGGPSEIRKAVDGMLLMAEGDVIDFDFGRLYPALEAGVADLGDVDPDGFRADHVGRRLCKVVRELLDHDMRPLVLGGDHSITHFVLSELIARGEPFGVIHFDAHHDLLPSRTLSHANVFRAALQSERVTRLLQLGLCGIERVTPYARRAACPKRSVLTAREVMQGKGMAALEALPKDVPYYLSFDIDCIDGSVAKETGTPSFGGLSYACALELVDHIARNFDLVGADFVEVAAAQGAHNMAASIAARLLQRCVLGTTAFEPLSTDVYTL